MKKFIINYRLLFVSCLLFLVFCLLFVVTPSVSAAETCPDGRFCGGTTECRPDPADPLNASICVCPGGLTCQNPTNPFDGSIGTTICGTNLRNWQCTGGGWIEQSSSCICSGGSTGCTSDTQCPSGQRCSINPSDGTGSCVPTGGGGGGGGGGGSGSTGLGTITAPPGFNLPFISGDPNVFVSGLVRNGIAIMIIVAFVVALIWTILAGFKFILANGEPKEVSAAWSQIRYGLIGLAVIMSAFAIIKLVETFFNVNIIGGGLQLPTRTS